MHAIISTFSKTFDDIGLVYFVPDFLESEIKKGTIVEVPIRNKIEIGVVLDIGEIKDFGLEIDPEKIKSLISIKNSTVFLNKVYLKILPWIAKYYFTPIHNSTCLFFPKNLREKITKNKLKFEANKLKYNFNYDKRLSKAQEKVYKNITTTENNKVLLHGITGSGKTEIYIKLIKENLDKGKQSLLLIPEIILTNQLSERLKEVFGEDIIVLNSTVSEAKKTKYWVDIYHGSAKIIIGTRSAIFYPYNNLGLIIIDEEHDNSYNSDNSPRYRTIEVVEKITKLNGNKLLLGSGTPSITTMYKAQKKKYKLINLFEKFS